MASISEVKTNITGVSRLNRFRVTLPTPDGVVAEVLVKASTLPGRTIDPMEIQHRGALIKIAGEPRFNDWSVEVYAESFSEYQRFFNWMEMLGEVDANTRGNPAIYKSNGVKVEQIGPDNSIIATATLNGVFPTSIDDISYSSDGADLVTFNVNFSIDNVRFEGAEGTVGAALSSLF